MWKKWFLKAEEVLQKNGDKQKRKLPWILGLGLLGIILLVVPSFYTKEKIPEEEAPTTLESTAQKKESGITTMQDYERYYETELKQILGEIVGVSDVELKLNLDSSEEEVFAQDTRETGQVTSEADKKGGNRSISQNTNDKKTAYYRGNNGERPVIIKKMKPKVRGVLVVARGVENLQVRAVVVEATQRILDVPVHRISVLPRK